MKRGFSHISCLIFMIGVLNVSNFAQTVPVETTFNFSAISAEQNLPHFATHHIMQDSFGFLWISTRDGLCRFDGNTCSVYRTSNQSEIKLEADLIWLTLEDSQKRLWIGTKGGGLSYYNPYSRSAKVFRSSANNSKTISGDIITTIFEDSAQNLWVGTDGNGLNKVHKTAAPDSFYFERIPLSKTMPQTTAIMDIIQQGNVLWVATYGSGIYLFDVNSHKVVNHYTVESGNLRLSDNYVMSLAKEDSLLWIGTKFGGITSINLQEEKTTVYSHDPSVPSSLPDNFVWDIHIDKNGNKWVSMYGGGLSMLPNGGESFVKVSDYGTEEAFSDDFVLHTMEDEQGQLWIATDNQGVFRFNTKPIYEPVKLVWPESENTFNLIINNLFRDSRDQFWILTNSGLFTSDQNFEYIEKRNTGLSTTIFYDIKESEDGRLWIASNNNLGYHNPETGIWGEIDISSEFNIPGTERFFDLEIDDEGIIWLASDGGLIRFNPENQDLRLFQHNPEDQNSISGNKLSDLELDGNHLWVATDDKGISIFHTKSLEARRLDLSDFLPPQSTSNYVSDITRDSKNTFLVGTTDKGFYHIYTSSTRIDSIRHYRIKDGTTPSRIFDIERINKEIFVSYRDGLTIYNKDNFASQDLKSPEAMNNSGSKELYFWRDQYYFFNRNKIYKIRRENIPDEKKYPELQLTSFKTLNTPVASASSIHTLEAVDLSYTDDLITLAYNSLNMDPNAFYSTEYMLEGQDPFWLSGGEAEVINYSNLKPGQYTFRVRYQDAVLPTKEIKLALTVEAPFWQTGWFYFAMIVLLLGILYSAVRYRTYYLLKEERTRMQIARDLHDDLSGTLSSISFFSSAAQCAENQMKDARVFLEKIDISAAEAKEKINDIIWAIDPSKDDWSTFLKKCKRYATDALDTREIEYSIQMDETFKTSVRLELRQNLWLIYKEMINNLVQHSEASQAEIKFYESNRSIYLIVKDNGKGFIPEDETSRNGIRNIQHRANLIGANLTLESKPGEGTKWEFELKV